MQTDRTQQRTIYVGGLPLETTKEIIDSVFLDCGEIVDFQIRKSQTNATAFVTFATHEQAETAIKECNYIKVNGNTIRISWQNVNHRDSKLPEANLVISNLPFSVEDHELHSYFSNFGEVESCRILRTKSGNSQGKGYVQFAKVEDADRALSELQNATIDNQMIVIEKFKPMEQRQNIPVQLPHQTICVNGPQEKINKENISTVFGKYGPISDIIFIENYCVVYFTNTPSATSTMTDAENLKAQGYKVESRVLKTIYLAILKTIESRKVFVADLINKSPEELRAHMAKAGQIVQFDVHEDKNGQHYASIQYDSEESQQRALCTLDRTSFGSQSLPIRVLSYVEKALPTQYGGMIMLPSLDYHTTYKQLRDEFSQYGKIVAVSISPTPLSTLVGFVLFQDYQVAKETQEKHLHKNSFLFPQLELSKFLPTFMSSVGYPNIFLYVSGIPKDTSDTQIYSQYTKYGRIYPVSSVIIGDEKFVFIRYAEQSGILTAAAALAKTNISHMILSANTLQRAQLLLVHEEMPIDYRNRFMFVNSLGASIQASVLFEIFSKNEGKVEAVFNSYDLLSWTDIGKAYVLFADVESASRSVYNPLQYTPELSDLISIVPFINRASSKEIAPTPAIPAPQLPAQKLIRQPRKFLRESVKAKKLADNIKEKLINSIASLSINETYEYATDENKFNKWCESVLE